MRSVLSSRGKHTPRLAAAQTASAAHTPATSAASMTRARGDVGRRGDNAEEARVKIAPSTAATAASIANKGSSHRKYANTSSRGGLLGSVVFDGTRFCSTDMGITPVDPPRERIVADALPAQAPLLGIAARATVVTNTANAAHSSDLQVVLCDQCVLASSYLDKKESVSFVWAIAEAERGDWERPVPRENKTPPTGAPNAAAKPAATPALRKSRPSASLWNASNMPPCFVPRICRVHRDATPAPTCTSGPSGPTGAPHATAKDAPGTKKKK